MQLYTSANSYSFKEWKVPFYPEDLHANGMLAHVRLEAAAGRDPQRWRRLPGRVRALRPIPAFFRTGCNARASRSDLMLVGTRMPFDTPGLFVVSTGALQIPLFDGFRGVAAPTRLGIFITDRRHGRQPHSRRARDVRAVELYAACVQLTFTSSVAAARDAVFAFHKDPENLRVLLAEWPATEVVCTAGHVRVGAHTVIRERMGPLQLNCTFEHDVYDPPEKFGERQIRGVFRRFEHVHEFHEDGPERTRVVDRIEVELPWWLGGTLAERLVARPRLERIFALRARAYERLAADGRFT